jgi:hypothetical protein
MKYCDRTPGKRLPFFGLCLSQREFDAEMKRLKITEHIPFVTPGSDATTHTLDNKRTGNTITVVCLQPNRRHKEYEVMALLVHEGVHIWQEYRRGLGEKEPSSEFEAYCVQAISEELFKAYLALTKRRRKK